MLQKILHTILIVVFLFINIISSTAFAENNIPYAAFKAAVRAYNSHPHRTHLLVIVDFDLPSTQKRLWVVNMDTHEVIYSTYVTHGSGSGGVYAESFSNTPESHKSSLGTYLTGSTYYGHNGLSRRVYGLDKTNSSAASRSIVIHGASYIGDGKTGRSWGCFAVPQDEAPGLIKLVGEGTILYAYHS